MTEETDEQFRMIVFRDMVEHGEAVINEIIALESESRHEMSCTGDAVAAGEAADRAYSMFMEIPLKMMPTVVMGLADKFNREHEAYTASLDLISDALDHVRNAMYELARNNRVLAIAHMDGVKDALEQVFDNCPYEKIQEEGS